MSNIDTLYFIMEFGLSIDGLAASNGSFVQHEQKSGFVFCRYPQVGMSDNPKSKASRYSCTNCPIWVSPYLACPICASRDYLTRISRMMLCPSDDLFMRFGWWVRLQDGGLPRQTNR